MVRQGFSGSIGTLVILGALGVASLAVNGFTQNTVTINVNGAASVVPDAMFGTLMERLGRQWGNGSNGGIWVGTASSISNTNGMRNDVINGFKECGVGSAQWPGGCAAWGYNWIPPNPSNDVGTDRFLQFCQLTGAEPLMCGPGNPTSGAQNLAWLKHIDSATAKLGMDSLRWFKIGNEVWGGCGGGVDAATHSAYFDSTYKRLHAYRPSPSLKLEAGSQNEDRGYASVSGFYNTEIATLGTKLDGVEYHDYIFRTTWRSDTPSTSNYWQIMYDGMVGDFAGHMRTNVIPVLNAADPSKRIKLIVDEWGDWLSVSNWMQTGTLMNGLSAANQLHLLMSYSDRIGVACLAQGVNVIHSLMNIQETSPWPMVKTPTFYVFKMFKPHHANGAKWAPISASTIQTTTQTATVTGSVTVPLMTVGSTVDNNGRVNVSVNNIDLTTARPITINLTSNQTEYVIDSAQIVTGTAMTANNPFNRAEEVNLQNFAASNFTLSNSGKTVTATLPARSIVMFRLKPANVSVQSFNALRNGPNAVAIKAGSPGTVLISASFSRKTSVIISLFGIDGRAYSEMYKGTLEPGNRNIVWRPKSIGRGTNLYVVKVTTDKSTQSQRVMF